MTVIARWHSSILAADLADWVTVFAYLLAAWLSLRAARRAERISALRERRFWQATVVLLVFLGINELLDLQTLLTALGRDHARANGWYGERRQVQYVFIVALAGMALVAGIALLWFARRAHRAVLLALAGLAFIGLFVLLRAASFHHLDHLLRAGPGLVSWGSMQEILGIAIVALASVLYRSENPRVR